MKPKYKPFLDYLFGIKRGGEKPPRFSNTPAWVRQETLAKAQAKRDMRCAKRLKEAEAMRGRAS